MLSRILLSGLLLASLALNSGCEVRESKAAVAKSNAAKADPWQYFDHGDPKVTLVRWANVGFDDHDEVYYIHFLSGPEVPPVNDTNVIILRELKNLLYLDLENTEVTDDGLLENSGGKLRPLANLSKLKILRLPSGCGDRCLGCLKHLTSLEHLYIHPEAEFTTAGVAQLEKWLPKCKVHFTPVFGEDIQQRGQPKPELKTY